MSGIRKVTLDVPSHLLETLEAFNRLDDQAEKTPEINRAQALRGKRDLEALKVAYWFAHALKDIEQ